MSTMTESEKDEIIMTLNQKNIELESRVIKLEAKVVEEKKYGLKIHESLLYNELQLITLAEVAYPYAIDTNTKEFQHLLSEK